MNKPEVIVGEILSTMKTAEKIMAEATVELTQLKLQNNWLKEQVDLARARCCYPQFCKHPGKCAGAGSCKAEWVCNE